MGQPLSSGCRADGEAAGWLNLKQEALVPEASRAEGASETGRASPP